MEFFQNTVTDAGKPDNSNSITSHSYTLPPLRSPLKQTLIAQSLSIGRESTTQKELSIIGVTTSKPPVIVQFF